MFEKNFEFFCFQNVMSAVFLFVAKRIPVNKLKRARGRERERNKVEGNIKNISLNECLFCARVFNFFLSFIHSTLPPLRQFSVNGCRWFLRRYFFE